MDHGGLRRSTEVKTSRGKKGPRPPSPPPPSGIGAQVRRPRPAPVTTSNPLVALMPSEVESDEELVAESANANDLMTTLWSGLSFFSDSNSALPSSAPAPQTGNTAPVAILSPKSRAGEDLAGDSERVVSPSPSSASEHPGLSEEEEQLPSSHQPRQGNSNPKKSSGKMRCTLCGVKVKASDTASHECDFNAMYTRCTHCGEKVPLLEAGSHLCDEAVTGRPTEPLTPSTPGASLGSEEPNTPDPTAPPSSWVMAAAPMDAFSGAVMSASSSILSLGGTQTGDEGGGSGNSPLPLSPSSPAPDSSQTVSDKAAAAIAVALSGGGSCDSGGGEAAGGGGDAQTTIDAAVEAPSGGSRPEQQQHLSTEQRARPWSLTVGYALDGAATGSSQDMPSGAQPCRFETPLFEGEFFMALKQDKTLDSDTYREFFHGKGRTCQAQWRVRLKRPLKGGLFLGFESNASNQTGPLPRSSVQSGLVSVLHLFHSKKDMHLQLPGMSSSSSSALSSPISSLTRGSSAGSSVGRSGGGVAINEQGDWGLGVAGRKALCCFVETPEGQKPPPLNRPLVGAPRVPSADLVPGPTYSFAWYTQYVEFSELSLVNLPMMGAYPLPLDALRFVLYEAGGQGDGDSSMDRSSSSTTPRRTTVRTMSLSGLVSSPMAGARAASATPPRPTSFGSNNNATPQGTAANNNLSVRTSASLSVSRAASTTPPRSLFGRSSSALPAFGPTAEGDDGGDSSPVPLPPPVPTTTPTSDSTSVNKTFERSPAAGAAAAAAANFLLRVGCVAAVGKKAKARLECGKASALVGDVPSGRKVLVLALGTAEDGTSRAKIRGPGLLAAESVPSSPPPPQADSGEPGSGGKRRKELVEIEGWVSASLLVDPAAVLQLGATSTSKLKKQPASAEDSALPETPAAAEMGAGSFDGRTYGFSCVFARNKSN